LLALLAGCAGPRYHVDQALMADRVPALGVGREVEDYLVAFPDVLTLTVPSRPRLTGNVRVEPDGYITLRGVGRVRVEGHNVSQIAGLVAARAGLDKDALDVDVAEFRSQQIYLYGASNGLQRAVDYRGPETVVELLRRTGGIKPGAAPGDIYVVRRNLTGEKASDVIQVDLRAIVEWGDRRTDVRLQPFDQVYVGETRNSLRLQSLPALLRPVCENLWDLRRPKPAE
jgi:protein involved in polysaccharide export with SLBB domain